MLPQRFQLIPADPNFIPSESALDQAIAHLKSHLTPAETLDVELFEFPKFIAPNNRILGARCNMCGVALELNWWDSAMNDAWLSHHANLAVHLPCCGQPSTLNDLSYKPTAGFARFRLALESAPLGRLHVAAIENILGCEIKTIERW